MGNICEEIVEKTTKAKVPKVKNDCLRIIFGLLNFFTFGFGTMFGGIGDDCDGAHIIIGLLQLFIPIVGWIWSIIWGILMILDR